MVLCKAANIFPVASALMIAVGAIVVQPSKNQRVQVDASPQAFPPNFPPPLPPLPPNRPPYFGSSQRPPSITVDLTEDSGRGLNQLPGSRSWIYFEVTNRRDFLAFLFFTAVDQRGFVTDVKPTMAELLPGRSVRVGVFLDVQRWEGGGTESNLTMTAQGNPDLFATRNVLLRVGRQETDTWAPSCWYKITRNCEDALDTWKCQSAFWNAEATLKDEQSGLLKVSSQPPLGFRYGAFYAGTKEEIKVTYQASCCEKEVVITGVDLQGNYGRCKINVGAGVLNAGEITAIVLGILLLIAIIVIIIAIIVVCRRRKQRSQNFKL